jgi:CopA family copper-resistance protein
MKNFSSTFITRRDFLGYSGSAALLATAKSVFPSFVWAEAAPVGLSKNSAVVIDIGISKVPLEIDGRFGTAIAMNGSVPGPLIRLKEGRDAILRVTNLLDEVTPIHWHGLLLPPEMDGVPGVSFGGIQPGETFTYRFPVKQSGTYWCHSHSGGQELLGLYAPLIIDPVEPEPFSYNRDYVVLLSDWSFESPERIIDNLKKSAGYYNYQRLTAGDFIHDARSKGLGATATEWLQWTRMRMDPTDLADVTGATYTYLMNGHTSASNWTGLFNTGEKVRIRFIDAGAMTYCQRRSEYVSGIAG